LSPEYANIENPDELFFKKGSSLGWSWHQKGVELKSIRLQINSNLQIDETNKGWSYTQKGVELFDKRSMTLFKILLLCLNAQSIEEIQLAIDFNTRNKLRELYLNPLRKEGFLEYTIKDKPNSPDQRYITTEQGRRFLGGFDI
jgi:predicted transcriptional regulator